MKKLIFLFILILLLPFACSKKSPTEADTFLLEVDNATIFTLEIFVDGNSAGTSQTNTKKEMGNFKKSSNTHLEAKYSGQTLAEIYEDTRNVDKVLFKIVM